ncbi:MAG: BON domain-containing protein [Chloroflexi bacterium]|nr:BON domain-containing protein [Chloroflexota bacterium]
MQYNREGLYHLITRALKRNTFTAAEDIEVVVLGEDILLLGSVSDADLIPEAVATVEAVAPFLHVYSQLRVRDERDQSVRA